MEYRIHNRDPRDEETRLEVRRLAPTRTHGAVTGLPREETIRPPDSPGYTARCELDDGTVLASGSIFTVRIRMEAPTRKYWATPQFVFRRAHIETGEITAWGPVNGHKNEGWHLFDPAQIVSVARAA